MARIRVEVDGETHSVERADVLAWAGVDPERGRAGAVAESHATSYVRANPRPEPDAQGGVNVPARQRRALLRRLAAGPATKGELLSAMRDAAGYVGGDDWRNRMDELRGRGKRGGGHPALPIVRERETDTYRLAESFPVLSEADRLELGRVKAVLRSAGTPVGRGRVLLDGLLPDVPVSPLGDAAVAYPSGDVLARLDEAIHGRHPVRIRWRGAGGQGPPDPDETDPDETGGDQTGDGRGGDGPGDGSERVHGPVVPLGYLPGGAAVRVHVAALDGDGRRVGGFDLPLDRVVEVERYEGPAAPTEVGTGPTTRLTLWVTPPLHDVLVRRSVLDLDGGRTAAPGAPDLLEVEGAFPTELSWEVLRLLLRWSGSVRVLTPQWLATAYAQRCLDGLVSQLRRPGLRPPGSPGPDPEMPGDRMERLRELSDDLAEALEGLVPPPTG